MLGTWREKLKEGMMDAIVNFFRDMSEAGIELMSLALAGVSSNIKESLEYQLVSNAIAYTTVVAYTLLAIKVCHEALMIYILRQGGDPHANPGDLLIRTLISGVLIGSIYPIVHMMLDIGIAFSQDIAGMAGGITRLDSSTMDPLTGAATFLSDYMMSILFLAFLLIASIILLLIIYLQLLVRTGRIAINAVAGPVMSISIQSEMFSTWWKDLLGLSLGFGIQLFMLKFAFTVLGNGFLDGDPHKIFFFIALLYLTIISPQILQKYIDSTGLAKIGGQSLNVLIMRRMARGR